MADGRGDRFREWIADGILNLCWFLLTAAGLVSVHFVWPFQSWSWGLLLGATVGGSAVFVTVALVSWSGADEWHFDMEGDI